ncbi:MAG: hypothetical protein QNL88_05460 [Acidobacteriota bacterium]|nr:hypothetical protein [Acidobacteriota bacterium]
MEQLRLLDLEVIVVVELDERRRDELVTLMAAAIAAVQQTEMEIDDE